jgi:S-methylmethionine-dependent homocysteine/selenocysteine methylase
MILQLSGSNNAMKLLVHVAWITNDPSNGQPIHPALSHLQQVPKQATALVLCVRKDDITARYAQLAKHTRNFQTSKNPDTLNPSPSAGP